ncbi:MAG: L-amino acid dehydrogenase [Phycisphaerae bacterium]|nr:L-amino acid dehydrogenase [Phycisphaerae bacterium]
MSRSLFARLAQRFRPQRCDALTRRELLKLTAAAGAGMLLSGGAASAGAALRGRRVVIVGAGFAGLACAHELRNAGCDVTVLEARRRVGGRVLSFRDFVPGKNVEGGAELIGSNHPTWVAYARQFELEFLDVTEDESLELPIHLDGRLLRGAETRRIWEEMETALSGMNAQAANVDADRPWESPNAAELDARSLAEWLAEQKLSPLTRKAVEIQLVSDNGVALERQSFLAMLTAVKGGGGERYWTESEVYRCKGGNGQLADKLADAIGRDRIVLELPVTQIDVDERRAQLISADGRRWEADDVVLAVPPTVWDRIRITPAPPEVLRTQMGTSIKYLTSLRSRFWKRLGLAPDAITDGPIGLTWELTDNQPDGEAAGMVAFSSAAAAERCLAVARQLRDARYQAEFERIYPGFAEQFVAARMMDWPKDEWTRGGYSFPAPGQITRAGPALRRGCGRLHFAGEHTCFKFVGFMEGGLASGVELARRLAVAEGAARGGG